MIKPSYDSLSLSLVLPFVALGFVVSALLSLLTFALVANSEERAIKRMLHVEMNSFRDRLARNPDALPPSTTEDGAFRHPRGDRVAQWQSKKRSLTTGKKNKSILIATRKRWPTPYWRF